ncbi:hypothetical protein Arno18_120 [Pectobacterium phage Arno18]|uniref:Putative endonuclease SegE-like GIY-YIG domain-containing protein n=1 Tax=Pectobacterium phage Arno18 TaxID=2500578 RepID=A0A678ZZL5_9CAUD|nr:hypothetical protein Arno18_120 [Pectobacterium phage Arno18]
MSKVTYGHWQSEVGEFNPDDYFGFLYLVYCKENKKFYIGKKQVISVSHKKVAGKVRRQKIVKESDWKTYQTSSQYVKADIEQFGTDKFDFHIVGLYKTKSGLKYAETNALHKLDTNRKESSKAERNWYNIAIDAVRFTVVEYDPDVMKRILKLIKSKGE